MTGIEEEEELNDHIQIESSIIIRTVWHKLPTKWILCCPFMANETKKKIINQFHQRNTQIV